MRTFVALPVPLEGEPLQWLKSLQGRLRESNADVRWARAEQWHVTLRFLGEIAESEAARVVTAMEAAAGATEPFHVQLRGAGAFPHERGPRVVWAGVEESSGRLVAELRERLEAALAEQGVPREKQSFHPHVTLGRVRTSGNREALIQGLNRPTEEGPEFPAHHIALYQSTLSPRGSTYRVVAEAPLGHGNHDQGQHHQTGETTIG